MRAVLSSLAEVLAAGSMQYAACISAASGCLPSARRRTLRRHAGRPSFPSAPSRSGSEHRPSVCRGAGIPVLAYSGQHRVCKNGNERGGEITQRDRRASVSC